MKQYKLYIFDLDLTAVDSVESSKICYKAAFEALGLSFDESQTNRYLNINLQQLYYEIEAQAPNSGMKFFNAFVQKSATAFAEFGKFYPEVDEVFSTITANGGKVGIFTNRSKMEIQSILDANPNINKNVAIFVGSDMVKNMKPAPDGIDMCAEQLGVAKEDILYVGDSPCDYEAATAAKVDFYYVDRFNNKAIPVEGHPTLEDMVK
ncbi:MAG: HAD family hydrolase [Bacilli bacterium]|nr:HAD family hydrolase [Bacilli bacterium]